MFDDVNDGWMVGEVDGLYFEVDDGERLLMVDG